VREGIPARTTLRFRIIFDGAQLAYPARASPRGARLDYADFDRQTAIGLLHGLSRFLASKEGDVKRLLDFEPPELRLRLGDFRTHFRDHGDWIEILRLRHRKDVYR
jgi:hypothetical protein